MSLSRKHFKEIAKILGSNMASNDMIQDFAYFCSSQNYYFQRQLCIDACEEHYQEAKKELEELINN